MTSLQDGHLMNIPGRSTGGKNATIRANGPKNIPAMYQPSPLRPLL
jgi:hypothetical protein